MSTSTGRLPLKFAGGLYKNPEIIFSSKLFHRTSSASGKASVFTAVSLVVHRSTFPVATSSEYTSPGPRALFRENPSSCPFLCQRREPPTPVGSFGRGIAFFVRHERNHFSVMCQIERFDVPCNVRRQVLRLLRQQIQVSQPVEFRILVRGDVNPLAILAEPSFAIRNFFRRVSWSQFHLFAGRRIHKPQVRFVDGSLFRQQNFPVIRRPIERLPPAASELRKQMVRLRSCRIHHPQIGICPCAPRGHVGDLVAAR